MSHPAYRPDIDGLRAIAVLPVLFYHVGVRGFSGGFVGVDIFFVISGYLITGILVRDIAIDRHSITEFYRRRILRIFPALIVVLAATTIYAWFALLPDEMHRFARSLGATALFVSNIGFYWQTDYFNPGAASQPLLHTWSLAVEEQWYIFWPLLLAAIGSRRPALMLWLAIGITLASFLASVWLLPRDAAASFYLLPARAWELGLGAVVAMLGARMPSRRVAEAAGVVGLLAIVASVKMYTNDMNFPGLAALPPCAGAALLIWSGRAQTLVSRLLALPPLRFVGLISYSLYLWHWPVVVFATTSLFLPASLTAMAGMILVSIVLAILSWRYVERPFRSGVGGVSTRLVLGGGAVAIAAVLVLAMASPAIERSVGDFTPRQQAIARYLDFDGDGAYRRGTCFEVGPRSRYDAKDCLATTGKPPILLVGDSHAAHLWPGLSRYRGEFDVLQATVTGCVAKIYPRPYRGYCEAVVNGALVGWLRTHRPAALILSSRWQWKTLDGVEATLRDPFVRAAHPILVGPIPQYTTALPRLLVFAERRRDPGLIRRSQLDDVFALDRALRDIAARTATPYVSLTDLMCRARDCRTFARPDVPMQFDFGHLTPEGSAVVVDAMMRRIRAVARAPAGR